MNVASAVQKMLASEAAAGSAHDTGQHASARYVIAYCHNDACRHTTK
jgi:hypothetical protein